VSDLLPVLVAGGLILFAVWWLLIESEGVYLGQRAVIWLYDLFAPRYDRIKQFAPEYEHYLLANPILGMIAPQVNPLVLDVATGTGRLPLALIDHPEFQGRVVAVDLSRRMLAQAAFKLRTASDRVVLLCCGAETLPFPDASFDVVTCLEALEFMHDRAAVLVEIARVLRPSGLLLTTNRVNTRWMPGRLVSDTALTTHLEALSFEVVEIEPWQVDYHRVWGLKAGDSAPIGARPLAEVLRCPRCQFMPLDASINAWRCPNCRLTLPIGADGVIDVRISAKILDS
jgi:ubiquinone/menaquinone biosynthesis C-methylase UbiE